jgi:hypothetical protein
MTVMEIARKTGMPEKSQATALSQLRDAGFISHRSDGAWVVERFREFQEVGSRDRTRVYREKKASREGCGDVAEASPSDRDVTSQSGHSQRHGDALDRDKEEDKDKTHTPGGREAEAVEDFVRWFVRAGIEIGPIAAHFDAEMEIRRELDRSRKEAEAMLKTYGRAECELRARRFFSAMQAAKLRGQPWIKTLSERWTWPEISGVEPPSKPSALRVVPPASNPDLDAIPDPIDPKTADFAALFARRGTT